MEASLLNLAFATGALFGGALVLRWILLHLLYRFAPVWMVGPGGFLIDTEGNLGILQMGDGHTHPNGDPAGPGGSDAGPRCD